VVGIFNRGLGSANVALPFKEIGVSGRVDAYNLWGQKDMGLIKNGYQVQVLQQDAVMLKLTATK
jgi:hypothetical protein